MAYSDGGTYQDQSSSSSHFYKIIREKTIREGKFVIPMKFVEKFGKFLSSPIVLEVPSGKSWQVELLKTEDKIWIEKGWQEFSDYLSLKYGHLVLFQYEGDCRFSVFIFDMSAVEIKYPGSGIPSMDKNHGRDFQQPKIQPNEDEDVISCEILDDSTAKANKSCKDLHVPCAEYEVHHEELMNEKGKNRQARKSASSESCQAIEAANRFISSNNPWLKIVIQRKTSVSIPFSFVERHMKSIPHIMMLRVAGKSWNVKFIVNSHRRIAILSAGWSAFARENSMRVGDVCMFELIEENAMIVSNSKCAK